MLTIDVHSKDTIEALSQRKDEMSVEHFEWQKQMRFYWHGDKEKDTAQDDAEQVEKEEKKEKEENGALKIEIIEM